MNERRILIMVIGPTGAGKTIFVNQATGYMLPVSRGTDLCTTCIAGVRYTSGRKEVSVIDTPGFGSYSKSDTEMLGYIAWNLGGMYKERKLLTGIVFLQPIYTDRVWEQETKLVQLIKSICGQHAYPNIIIATSTPNHCPDGKFARDQIRSRKQILWRDLIDGGARVRQHRNSRQSAKRIVDELVDGRIVVLDLQYELEMNDGRLMATTAAREAHQVAYGLYLSEQQRLYAEIWQLKHQFSMSKYDNSYLQRRCAALELERSTKKIDEQEVQRKKVYWSDEAREWIIRIVTAGGVAAATEIGKDMCACQ